MISGSPQVASRSRRVQYFGPASEQPAATLATSSRAHDHRRVVIRARMRVTRPYRGLKQLAAEVVNPAQPTSALTVFVPDRVAIRTRWAR